MIRAIALLSALAGPLVVALLPVPADAGPRRAAAVPIKDCTPYNGRNGFYGNIWCTKAERLRWERWRLGR